MKIIYTAETVSVSDLHHVQARAARRKGEAGSAGHAVNDRIVRDIERVARLTAEFQRQTQHPFLRFPSPLTNEFHRAAITSFAHALGCLAELRIHLRDTAHAMPPLLGRIVAREGAAIDRELMARNRVMEQEVAIYKNNKALVDACVAQSFAWFSMPYQMAFGAGVEMMGSWGKILEPQPRPRPDLKLLGSRPG